MFLFYFFRCLYKFVKYLQRVPLDVSLTGAICIKMQEKNIQKY